MCRSSPFHCYVHIHVTLFLIGNHIWLRHCIHTSPRRFHESIIINPRFIITQYFQMYARICQRVGRGSLFCLTGSLDINSRSKSKRSEEEEDGILAHGDFLVSRLYVYSPSRRLALSPKNETRHHRRLRKRGYCILRRLGIRSCR